MALNITKSETQSNMDLKKTLHNDIYEFIVCQKCEEVPKEGPIFSCDGGDHATCNVCFHTSKVCKCKANIKHRSKVLEKIRTTLPLSCKFRKNGCNSVLTLESLLYHEVDCQFRLIFCPSCPVKEVPNIVFKNFEDHLSEHHKDMAYAYTSYHERRFTVKESLLAFTTSTVSWTLKFDFNKAHFFRMMAKEKDRFYIWIYYYGSMGEAENYNSTIKVFGGTGEEYIYNGPPRSLDESINQIIRDENALILGVGQVKRLLVNEALQCSVKMSCPKDEAKDEDVESGVSDNEDEHQPKKLKT
jgi:hypothetical protein